MSFEDIKISELPPLSKVSNEDTLVVNYKETQLTYQVSWDNLKNSLGTLANPVIFPLGTVEVPGVGIGDNSSGIYAEDYGTLTLVTQARNRLQIDQAGTISLLNGHVVVGSFDRTCVYTFTVNNTSTFNCYVTFNQGIQVNGDATLGNLLVTGDAVFEGDITLGTDCESTVILNGESIVECGLTVKGDTNLKADLDVSGDVIIDGSLNIGAPNGGCLGELDVHSPAVFNCDVTMNGENITIGGSDCDSSNVILNGAVDIVCGLEISGDLEIDGNLAVNGDTIDLGEPGLGCQPPGAQINVNGQLNVECGAGIGGDVTIDGDLNVKGDTQLDGNVDIGIPGCGTPEQLSVHSPTQIDCELNVEGDATFTGDVTIGGDCDDNLVVQATQHNKCDIYIGPSVPFFDASGNVDPLGDWKAKIESTTGDITTNGNFIGDGSKLFNLAKPNAMLFHGDIDATAATAPTGAEPGDFWLNTEDGNVTTSWPDIGGLAISQDQFIYFSQIAYDPATDVATYKWFLGAIQNNQGFVTLNTPQTITGDKTFTGGAHTIESSVVTIGTDCATDTLEVNASVKFNCGFQIGDPNNPCAAGDSFDIHSETNIDCDLNVGGDLTVEGDTVLEGGLEIGTGDCSTGDVTIHAPVDIECDLNVGGDLTVEGDTTLEGELNLSDGNDINIGNGDLIVHGNTQLGDDCAKDTLTITATTSINCPTTVFNTFTVSGDFDTTLGGTLTVADDKATILGGTLQVKKATTLNDTLAVTGNTTIGGTNVKLNADGSGEFVKKVTSQSTVSTDDGKTLVTLDYLRPNAGGLVQDVVGGDGIAATRDTLTDIITVDVDLVGGQDGLEFVGNKLTSSISTDANLGSVSIGNGISVTAAGNISAKPADDSIIVDASGIKVDWTKNSEPGLWENSGSTDVHVTVTGKNVVPNGTSTTIGTAAKPWSVVHATNVNAGDINMSNMDHEVGNDVDGTKGMWSIQEGEDELYVINRLTGKKYKMNLTPV